MAACRLTACHRKEDHELCHRSVNVQSVLHRSELQEVCIDWFFRAVWILCILFVGCSNSGQLCSCSRRSWKVGGVSIFQEVVLGSLEAPVFLVECISEGLD